MEERLIEIYERQILMLLEPYKISKDKNGIQLINLNANAFYEIKKFYMHFIKSFDERCLDEAIQRLLPELRVEVDHELIEDIASFLNK